MKHEIHNKSCSVLQTSGLANGDVCKQRGAAFILPEAHNLQFEYDSPHIDYKLCVSYTAVTAPKHHNYYPH